MVEYYGHNDWRDYHLSHHGVLGMHWGIRRYQPYGIGYLRKNGETGKNIGDARSYKSEVDLSSRIKRKANKISNKFEKAYKTREIKSIEKKYARADKKTDKKISKLEEKLNKQISKGNIKGQKQTEQELEKLFANKHIQSKLKNVEKQEVMKMKTKDIVKKEAVAVGKAAAAMAVMTIGSYAITAAANAAVYTTTAAVATKSTETALAFQSGANVATKVINSPVVKTLDRIEDGAEALGLYVGAKSIDRANSNKKEKQKIEAEASRYGEKKTREMVSKSTKQNAENERKKEIAKIENRRAIYAESADALRKTYDRVKNDENKTEKLKKYYRDGVAESEMYERALKANLDYHKDTKSDTHYDTYRKDAKKDIEKIAKKYDYEIDDKEIDRILDREMKK